MGKPYSIQLLRRASEKGVERIVEQIASGATEELQEAAQDIQFTIATTPSAIVVGKGDRIDTGTMFDSVDFEQVTQIGARHWRGRVGWVHHKKDYFKTQEHGGLLRRPKGQHIGIWPMHALVGASILLRENLKARFG